MILTLAPLAAAALRLETKEKTPSALLQTGENGL